MGHIADPGAVNAWNYATKFTPTLQRTRQTTEEGSPPFQKDVQELYRSCAELCRVCTEFLVENSAELYGRSARQYRVTAGLSTVKYSLVQTSYGKYKDVQSTAGLSTELQQDLVQFSTG